MMSCIVLAGQILLFSSSPDGEAIAFPTGVGVQIDPADRLDVSKRTRFKFFSDAHEEHPSEVYTFAPYAEVVAALADCETQ